MRNGSSPLERSVPARTNRCVFALGASDLMQSIPPEQIHDLDAILSRLLTRDISVLLCGMRARPWIGS